jgi:uncharacterized RDD family membrane protein YckC
MQTNLLLQCPPAGLFKQLVAMLYDSFLIAALLFIATAILLPFNHGEAVSGPLYNIYLLSILFIFYSGFWQKAGQTLGMKAWKIRIIDEYGNNPPWSIGFLRLFIASFLPVTALALNQLFNLITNSKTEAIICVFVFLMGYLVRLVRPFTVHDRLSQTKVIDISQLLKQQQEASS